MDFTHLFPQATSIKRVNGRAPADTNIKLLGLTDEAVKILTPSAAKLTKAQLETLATHPAAAKELGLAVTDINSIKAAFTTPMQISPLAPMSIDVSCCCCTPCCCAAAVPIEQAVC
jgi:dsDNA-binding SOS-regulon protein